MALVYYPRVKKITVLQGHCTRTNMVISPPYKNFFGYFSTKTSVVGSQKNHLNEMVLLSTQNIEMLLFPTHNRCFKLMDPKEKNS